MNRPIGRQGSSKRRQAPALSRRSEPPNRSETAARAAYRGDIDRTTSSSALRRRVSVLFADLRGFTRLASRLDPSQVVRLLDDFFTVMTDVAVGHRATIDQVISDAFLLLYGVPTPRRDDCARAVRTALDMQRAFLSLRNRWIAERRVSAGDLGLGIGVATGDVVIANIKAAQRVGQAAVGEPLNRAVRLCEAARPADSLIDEATYCGSRSALDGEVIFTSREVSLKQREIVSAYRVQRRRAGLHIVPRRAALDPVCGVQLAPQGALRRRRQGKTYYFCSHTCARRFLEDPKAFGE